MWSSNKQRPSLINRSILVPLYNENTDQFWGFLLYILFSQLKSIFCTPILAPWAGSVCPAKFMLCAALPCCMLPLSALHAACCIACCMLLCMLCAVLLCCASAAFSFSCRLARCPGPALHTELHYCRACLYVITCPALCALCALYALPVCSACVFWQAICPGMLLAGQFWAAPLAALAALAAFPSCAGSAPPGLHLAAETAWPPGSQGWARQLACILSTNFWALTGLH